MDTQRKRYRAFISYSQRDKAIACRVHRALETYRVPKGIVAAIGPNRTLGRFFRDDDEMGANQSLGAALEGALDDSENLIVICSPWASRSKWVDAEVRHFKARGDARVFAIIATGEPHAADPSRECLPPSLKVKIDAEGRPTGERDEPRAPDLQRDGIQRVRVQLAAGLLDVPFDELWQRDRRRAQRTKLLTSAAGLLVVAVLGISGLGWLRAQSEARTQAAYQAVAQARTATADGRIDEALNRLAPFLEYRETQELVESPLRALLGWIPDPQAQLKGSGIQPARLRDATVLLDPELGVYDVSDIGLKLERLIRSRDGQRLVVIGDQRVVVFKAKTGQRLAEVDNAEVKWLGHSFEAPSGMILVAGAVLGPTNGSVRPFTLTISADGKTVQRQEIRAHMLWGSAVGVTPKCDALLVAIEGDAWTWQVEARALASAGLSDPTQLSSCRASGNLDTAGVTGLSRIGAAFETRNAFLGETERNPFTAAGCPPLGLDDGRAAGSLELRGARVATLDLGLFFEEADRWMAQAITAGSSSAAATYLPNCTEAQPCPIVGAQRGETYVRDDLPRTSDDEIGPPPEPRWSRKAASAVSSTIPIFFEHLVFNGGHRLTLCRRKEGRDACFQANAMGEDHLELPILRSPDGRYLFWPFAGSVVDLETLHPLTAVRAIPRTPGAHFDFEFDRPGLTLAFDGSLVSFVPDATRDAWVRTDSERASARFGILAAASNEAPLHTLASLGGRQYLAVRRNGAMARLDAATNEEVWRVNAVGLGEIQDVQLNPERQHVLLIGKSAWRLFRLADGFALSSLLAPPPAIEQSIEASTCRLEDALGPEGGVVASCGGGAFVWRPREYEGEITPRLARLTCAADVSTSTVDAIRRCYVDRSRHLSGALRGG
jgi:hypothetical protein